MAQLKDLIVNGASQLIGDVITNNIQITKLNAPIASNGSTYGIGSEGQVLLTNGNSIYWGTIASTSITGLAPVATSGSYNDLNNKPTLFSGNYNDLTNKPTIPAAQVQTDWNATTGLSSIKNKPTLSSVATSGSYNDLSNKPSLNFLPLTGGEVTGNITLKAGANTDSPAIIFQRGTLTDNYNDWKVYDSGGYLYFGQRGSGSTDFNRSIYFDTTGNIHANLQGNASSATTANSVRAKLTIGTYEYDGSSAIDIPIYDGTIEDTLLAAEGVSF